ncbi:hypothetical protein ASPZODRAFT_138284 [Penicilliopsis zonata CBS 506.65]|uniref:Sister chromatid cohesion protein Dcc1 n=1 Tax=Penicilliopsis zonata CBS 506.65 TaxID=1073090 RepID=A0A1L9SVD5_9EURO|nr:hypothetical protein ASPZODRAFT_138284 [Penicilliopsis zonata CBS 506.65]OJJ51175.1 hypothetical protein ASPZODRAFT_138284 [Penicilliopsis zonata CBS 506.65]
MSTQGAPSVRFTHTSPQQGFKLLELPPELLNLLTSDDAPIIEIKTPSKIIQSTASSDGREFINLCTPSQTYRVRQVQSSNSIHVMKPSEVPPDATSLNPEDAFVSSMTAIAKCGSTLELHTPPEGFGVCLMLQNGLRVYDRLSSEGPMMDMDMDMDMEDTSMGGGNDINQRVARERLFADVPVSREQCEKGWVDLCAFVHGSPGTCWRPSAVVRLDVWKRVMEGSILQGIDLEKQFLILDLWKAVRDDDDDDDEEPFPRPLFDAVIRRLCDSETIREEFKWASIDRLLCIQWVGETYLEAMAPMATSAITRNEFLNAWRDHLPESWREEVALSKLTEGCYALPEPTTIYHTSETERERIKRGIQRGGTTAASAAATAKTTRNWHELFKSQRR